MAGISFVKVGANLIRMSVDDSTPWALTKGLRSKGITIQIDNIIGLNKMPSNNLEDIQSVDIILANSMSYPIKWEMIDTSVHSGITDNGKLYDLLEGLITL